MAPTTIAAMVKTRPKTDQYFIGKELNRKQPERQPPFAPKTNRHCTLFLRWPSHYTPARAAQGE
jgi:hypothetical protein